MCLLTVAPLTPKVAAISLLVRAFATSLSTFFCRAVSGITVFANSSRLLGKLL